MQHRVLAFIGAGNMSRSIIAGLIQAGYPAERIIAANPSRPKLDELASQFGIRITQDNAEAAREAEVIVLAVKGSSTRGKAVLSRPTDVEVTWRGQRIQRGLKLWLVGTDIVKGLIYGRLRQSVPGPGYIHLPKALANTDEFDQLTAERLVTKYVKGHARMEWVKPSGRRNEALDCAVYAYAAAVWAGIERYTEIQWQRLEDRVAPRVRDLFVAAPVAADLQAPDADAKPVASDAAAPESALQSAASDNTPALQPAPKPNPLFQRPARRPIQPTRAW